MTRKLTKIDDKEGKTIIEINGIKMEVDLREAKIISNYKIGDKVKVLIKEYDDRYKTYSGIILDFYQFKSSPAIMIAYVDNSYSEASIQFKTVTNETTDVDFAPLKEFELNINESDIVNKFDNAILKANEVLAKAENQKACFMKHFSKYFKK